jgi:glutamine cyclotransferase
MRIKESYDYFNLLKCLFIFCQLLIYPLAAVETLVPVVISKIPHDTTAFTQGLAFDGGQLYESTGLYGQSSLRRLDPSTGKILQKLVLPSHVFAEGIASFSGQLFQITWREQVAFVYDRSSFKLLTALSYQGDGWGLCCDGKSLWMSDGSSTLIQRHPETFAIQNTLPVHCMGQPVLKLNDLECVGNELYANVWKTDHIVRVNKRTGEVTGIVDASQLLTPRERALLGTDDVLNGIAFRSETKTFFLTGKRWPWLFEVHFVSKNK